MGNLKSGRDIHLGFGKETTFGTGVTSSAHLKHTGISGGLKKEFVESQSRIGKRGKTGAFIANTYGQASYPFELDQEIAGFLLKMLCKNEVVAVVDTTDYKHTFTPSDGSELNHYSLEVGYSDVKTYRWISAVLNSLSLDLSAKSIVTGSAEILFYDEDEVTPTSPSYGSIRPFTYQDGSIELDDASFMEVRNASMQFSNNVSQDDFRIGGGGKFNSLPAQGLDISGELNVAFNSDGVALRDDFKAGTYKKIQLTLDTGIEIAPGEETYKLVITIPKALLKTGDIDGAEDGMMIPMSFTAYEDGTNPMVTFELFNDQATEY